METKEELFSKLAAPEYMDNILLLTHTDLDGAGAAVIIRSCFSRVTVKHCSNNSMSKDILEACVSAKQDGYDFIIACDISCSDEDAAEIDRIPQIANYFVLIDHHPSSVSLNRFKWAVIHPDMVSDSFRAKEYTNPLVGHSSGTALLYDYLEYFNAIQGSQVLNVHFLRKFVSLVSKYDTWDWETLFKSCEPKTLSSLCFIYGLDYFEDTMTERIKHPQANLTSIFTSVDEVVLRCEQQKIERYVKNVRKAYRYGTITLADREYNIVYCATSQYLPQTFEDMEDKYPGRDIYMINHGNGISMRARKDSIDLSVIAKQLGGGGHKGAGGIPIPFEKQIAYFESAIGTKFNYQQNITETSFFS